MEPFPVLRVIWFGEIRKNPFRGIFEKNDFAKANYPQSGESDFDLLLVLRQQKATVPSGD